MFHCSRDFRDLDSHQAGTLVKAYIWPFSAVNFWLAEQRCSVVTSRHGFEI
jgi:hypothetical protein